MDNKKAIVIVRGDDTDFNGANFLTINLNTEILDLTTFSATFTLGNIIKTFNDLSSGSIKLNFSSAETKNLPPVCYGVLKLVDENKKIGTIESLIPFKVISVIDGNAIATEPYTLNFDVEQGGQTILNISVESAVTVEVGTTTTLPSGSDATVTNSGTSNHLVLDFGIPQGEAGQDGKDGIDGKDGSDGKDAKINNVTTLALTANYGLTLTQSGSTANISGKEITDVVDGISAVIPAQATEQNQLADKSFVNSSIATNTANFIGTFNSVAELEAYSGTVTNNDYAFVVGTDSDGNTVYVRYKYNANDQEWLYEYELNNSSFTAVQWASINSGITSTAVTTIGTALQPNDNITNLTNNAGFITTSALANYQQKPTVTTISSGDNITLADNTIYNGAELSSLTITTSSSATVGFGCELYFSSGATATTLTASNITFTGDDTVNGVFTPASSKRYSCIIYYDGSNYNGVSRGV